MPPLTASPLLWSALGHAAGAAIFGTFAALLLRSRRTLTAESRPTLWAALLALAWNALSFAAIAASPAPSRWQDAALAALTLLPGPLLALCLQGRAPRLVRLGYVLTALAALLHLTEESLPALPLHYAGLLLISFGVGTLAAAAIVLDLRRSARRGQFATFALLLLAVSFLHFADHESAHGWLAELLLHHAAIPIGLFILVQDYRLLFLDVLLRLLTRMLTAGAFAAGLLAALPQLRLRSPVTQALALVGLAAAFVLYAAAVRWLERALTALVLRRRESSLLVAALAAAARQTASADDYWDAAARLIADHLEAVLVPAPPPPADLLLPTLTNAGGAELLIPVRGFPGRALLALGRRRGGRPYLSEDLRLVTQAAAQMAEQGERFRQSETRRLVNQAELRALQAQINPHFLFNALNTVYGIIPREARTARQMVLHLSDLFRYFLQSDRTTVPLEQELAIVRSYLELESARLGGKLQVTIAVPEECLRVQIPVLSVQPLVENAIKHGVAAQPQGGSLRVEAEQTSNGLVIRISDTGPGFGLSAGSGAGIGLDNVRRRLELSFGTRGYLDIASSAQGTTVALTVPGEPAAAVRP